MPAKGITVYLPKDLEAKVRMAAIDQHRSESSVIAEAVRARLGRHSASPAEPIAAEHHVSRLDARLEKLVGESLIVKEIVLLFVRVWLEHNPPVDEAHEDAAAASAEARFERFLILVAQGLQSGRSRANGSLYAPGAQEESQQNPDAAAPP
jgi:flagellar biosynthesis component FlhA